MRRRSHPDPRCPVRPGEPCTLCEMGATGPQDCPLVYLVMSDDELRAGVHAAALRARPAQHPEAAADVPPSVEAGRTSGA